MLTSTIVVASLAAAQGSPRPSPDDEDADMTGRQTFVENCLICHGEEMTTAARLTTKQWTTEVEKMVGWGAPVPVEKKSALLAYLSESFSNHVAPPPPITATSQELLPAERPHATTSRGVADRGASLYTQHCATCHGATGLGGDLGPILVERSILLNEPAYHEAVRKGQRRMPGFANVLKPDAEDDLLAWLRTKRVP